MNNEINNEENSDFTVKPLNFDTDFNTNDEYIDDDGDYNGNNNDTVDADGDPVDEG